jgi:hypothetical protein
MLRVRFAPHQAHASPAAPASGWHEVGCRQGRHGFFRLSSLLSAAMYSIETMLRLSRICPCLKIEFESLPMIPPSSFLSVKIAIPPRDLLDACISADCPIVLRLYKVAGLLVGQHGVGGGGP